MNPDASANSLERALKVLDLFAGKTKGLTNAEISRRIPMATSTCSYILSRLERHEFLERDPETLRYQIGLKVLALGHSALSRIPVRKVAAPALHRLASQTRMTCLIGVLERHSVVVVEKVESSEFIRVGVSIGYLFPLFETALGKALIAGFPQDKLRDLVKRENRRAGRQKAVLSETHVLSDLEAVQQQGWAVNDGQGFVDVKTIAAPILDVNGKVCAAVSAAGPKHQDVWDRPQQEIVDLVKSAARDISRRRPFTAD